MRHRNTVRPARHRIVPPESSQAVPTLQKLGDLDSNQNKQNQNLLCYRYTIPQNAVHRDLLLFPHAVDHIAPATHSGLSLYPIVVRRSNPHQHPQFLSLRPAGFCTLPAWVAAAVTLCKISTLMGTAINCGNHQISPEIGSRTDSAGFAAWLLAHALQKRLPARHAAPPPTHPAQGLCR